jgi:hypothetical protein
MSLFYSPTGTTHQHTPKAEAVAAATIGRVVVAAGRQQEAGTAEVPRRTAQHTVRVARPVPVLAPFPHVAADVVEAQFIGRKTSRR